ncbi:unnamed protein product [Closterium sp. NIES-53]
MRQRQRNGASCPVPGDLQAEVALQLTKASASVCAAAPTEDHFLSLDPTSLIVDLLEHHLLATETSAVAVGAARGTPRTHFFEGCSPSPLTPSYASNAALDVLGVEDVGAVSASAKRCSNKGKGGRGGGGGSGVCGGGSSGGGGGSGSGGDSGSGGESGGGSGGGGGSSGGGGSGGSGSSGGRAGATQCGGSGGGQRQQQQRRSDTPSPQQLREWFSQRGESRGSGSCPYRAEFGDEAKRPRWAELLRSGVAIFDLDFVAILAAMYALSVSAEGDCYFCVPPDPRIEAGALGASESALPGTAPAEALHTFTLDSSASCLELPSRMQWSACVDMHVYTDGPSPGHVHSSARFKSVHTGYRASSGSCICPSVRVRSGSTPLLVSPPVAPNSPVAPPPKSPIRATPSWHALPPPCLWSSQLSASPPALAFPALPSLRRGTAVRRSSLLLVSPDDCSPADSPHGRCSSASGSSKTFLSCVCTLTEVQNGIAECRIGLVMQATRTSMIHAAAPHFLWPFAVQYAAHQLNLWPRVSLPETSPTLRRLAMRWCSGSWALVLLFAIRPRKSSPPALSPESSLAFPLMRLAGSFTTPPRAVSSPHRTSRLTSPFPFIVSSPTALPLPCPRRYCSRTVPVEVGGDSGAAQDATSGGAASGGAEPGGAEPGGVESEGVRSWGAEPGGVEPRGAEPEGVEPGGAESEGAESGDAEPRVTASTGGLAGASPRLSPRPEPLSPQQLHEWFAQRTRLRSGAAGARDPAAGDTGAGGAAAAGPGGARTRAAGAGGTGAGGDGAGGARAVCAGAGGSGAGGAGAGGAGALGAGAGDTGAGGAGAGGAGAVDPGAGGAGVGGAVSGGIGAGGTARSRPDFVPLLQQSASRLASLVHTGRRAPRLRPPPVTSTHAMALHPSSIPLRVPLPPLPESSLPAFPVPESDRARAASPTVSRLLATVVSDPFFESTTASTLIAELVDVAAACRSDYAAALAAESESASPPFVRGECALGTDVHEDRQEDFECLAAAVPRFTSMLLAPEGDPDAPDIPTPRSYAEAITGPYSS